MDILIIPPIDSNLYCPKCGSANVIKRGFWKKGKFSVKQQQLYGCKDCDRRFFFGSTYGNAIMLPLPEKCPNCNSKNIRQKGYTATKNKKPKYVCKECGYQFVEKPFGIVDAKEYNEYIKKHPRKMRTELMDAKR